MSQYDMTVVLTVYNQSLEDIEKSLSSVAVQEGCEYELIVGDDHSNDDLTQQIEEACERLKIKNFKVLRHASNLKTVGNILGCVKHAQGKYVKAFGSGDMLFNESTLRDIVAFCSKNGVKAGFGNVIIEKTGEQFAAPRNVEMYELGKEPDRKKLLKHAVMWADWIPGGAHFFDRECALTLLKSLYEDYSVRYCEDLAQTIALIAMVPSHLDLPILIYDNEGGISTSGSVKSRTSMYDDHMRFYEGLRRARPYGLSFSMEYAYFSLRRFIALKTPLYVFLQKMIMKSYLRKGVSDERE